MTRKTATRILAVSKKAGKNTCVSEEGGTMNVGEKWGTKRKEENYKNLRKWGKERGRK